MSYRTYIALDNYTNISVPPNPIIRGYNNASNKHERLFENVLIRVQLHVTIDHVMPREKRWGALDSCFGLVSPHQQSIPQLLSLASRVYKGKVECSTCGFELMRFIPTRLCSGAALACMHHP